MWKTAKLGELCDISIGKTPPRGDIRMWDKERQTDNVWLSIADINASDSIFVSDSKEYVSDAGAALFKSVPKDTLIMSFKLSIGKLAFTARELRTNEAIAALPINDTAVISKEYLRYFLSSQNWDRIAGDDVKVKGKTLNKAKLKEIEVQFPPLSEQQRIVDKLDAAFAEIDKAVDDTYTSLQSANSIAANWLKHSFAQLDNGSELFLSLAVGDKSLASKEGWTWLRLLDIAKLESGHTPSRRKPEYWGGDIGWVGIKDARRHHAGVIYDTEQKTNSLGIANSSARILPKDTVCLSRTASVGYVFRLGADMATSQDFVNWVCSDQLLPEFLQLLLLSEGKNISRFGTGAVHKTIYFDTVKEFYVCIPNLHNQQNLINEYQPISSHANNLLSFYEEKASKLISLKSAILAQELQSEVV